MDEIINKKLFVTITSGFYLKLFSIDISTVERSKTVGDQLGITIWTESTSLFFGKL